MATNIGLVFKNGKLLGGAGGGGGVPDAHQATHRPGGSDALPWSSIHGYGLAADRPAAASSNVSYIYYAHDTNTLSRSNGTTWDTLEIDATLDADLVTIAALDSGTSAGVMATEGAGWVKRTYAQVKTSLGLTKSDVSLGNVDNTSDANKPISTATQTALDNKQALDADLTTIAALDSGTSAGVMATEGAGWVKRTYAQIKTSLSLTKSDVGLGSVDNTTDADKPVSTATQTALDLKQDLSGKGVANGYAELDSGGLVPSAQLPSYVDDVIEAANFAALPGTGTTGKIYVTLDDNKTYRWSGSAYVEISASLALGETSGTAYRGDRGKTAYDHSQLTSGNPHNVSKSDVGLGNVDNVQQQPLDADLTTIAALDSGTSAGVMATEGSGWVKRTYAQVKTSLAIAFGDISGTITTAQIGADQVTNAKIADDQIDSEHYVDGSIDTAHIADAQVTGVKTSAAMNAVRLSATFTAAGSVHFLDCPAFSLTAVVESGTGTWEIKKNNVSLATEASNAFPYAIADGDDLELICTSPTGTYAFVAKGAISA